MTDPIKLVDPFIGCEQTTLPPPQGIAATWWWPKAQVGNTHPGAICPLGMVSVCPYSGAYPTGYGLYDKNTDGHPRRLFDTYQASGFTHFHQSGTGAIRKYYNYLRVTPMLGPLTELGQNWPLRDEHAEPGYYRCTLGDTGITAELTTAPKAAIHRYTFPQARRANLILDCSRGGIDIPYGRTVPTLADVEVLSPDTARAKLVVEGVPLHVWIELDQEQWKYGVWFDKKNVGGGRQLVFDHIRESTLTPFGIHFGGPTEAGQPVELRLGFSWRSTDQARSNLHATLANSSTPTAPTATRHAPSGTSAFKHVKHLTQHTWRNDLSRIAVEGGSDDQQKLFYTALYHSLIKPSDATGESPFWPGSGPFFYDFCTMWDIYKTQLPLLMTLYPKRSAAIITSLLTICEQEGNFPIGYRMARGADRFQGQASALAHVSFLDAYYRDLPVDWDQALTYLDKDLHRAYGEAFLEGGRPVHPIVHTLDLAYGCYCTAKLASAMDDPELAQRMAQHAGRWRQAFDPETGLLIDSSFYEGGKWNYSFRFLADMAGRIELAGGDEAFVALLDRFFGYDAEPCTQLTMPPYPEAYAAGLALNRFQGLNNEPDMEAPYAYHYAGRPDRTAEVVRAVLQHAFTTGRGGLPGNDDSGALSSWYVCSATGLFPVAGQDTVLIGSPLFPRCTYHLPASTFTVTAEGVSDDVIYIRSAKLNGRDLDRAYLSVGELLAGGELELTMCASPSDWARHARPPSETM